MALMATKADKSQLHYALDHVELACHGPSPYAPYCCFQLGWLVGYDGVIGAGHSVQEDFKLAPETEKFRHAIARAGQPYNLTHHTDGTLTVAGNKTRFKVQTFPLSSMPNVSPDNPCVTADSSILQSLANAALITKARNDHVVTASVLLRQNSSVGTDGGTIIESHHGAKLPGQWLLPTEFAVAANKVKRELTHIGWSDTTFTAWFGPHAWLRTNTFDVVYPDTDLIFAQLRSESNDYRNVPVDLRLALETLKPFRDSDMTYIYDNLIATNETGMGAFHALQHFLPNGLVPTNGLMMAAMHGKWIAFGKSGFYWFGDVVRGVTALGAK